jgi:hypothetical protein
LLAAITGAALVPLTRRVPTQTATAQPPAGSIVIWFDPAGVRQAEQCLRAMSEAGSSLSRIGANIADLGEQLARPLVDQAQLTTRLVAALDSM